ncbi:hypothetical protein ACO03V_15680 [Microbacterium sp. HMH0099]|uniref:hypothetical protein n=1 Tax=Microbacterium sp. HMH0099 TaxID=3414026 RepID=UPI003BF65B10
MRRVLYAGGEFVTTDVTATSLLRFTAGLGAIGTADIVEVPIARKDTEVGSVTAQLVINSSSDILTLPAAWSGVEPDFSGEALMLQMRPGYPRSPSRNVPVNPRPRWAYEPEFGGW